MKRNWINRLKSLAATAAAVAGLSLAGASALAQDTVKIGVLHSVRGTVASSETSLRDVVLMAVDEINGAGGMKVGGKTYTIEPVVVDPASDWPLFAEKAKQLIIQDKVAVTFGCWTSVSRKSVLPVFESKYTEGQRSEEHTSELQSQSNLVCRLLLEKKKKREK